MPSEPMLTDWTVEGTPAALFREAATDMVVNHKLTLFSWFRDGKCSHEKNVEASTRWPQRYFDATAIGHPVKLSRPMPVKPSPADG
jgi:hypothetical protein